MTDDLSRTRAGNTIIVEVPILIGDDSGIQKAQWALAYFGGLDTVLLAARRDRLAMRPPMPVGEYDSNISLLEAMQSAMLGEGPLTGWHHWPGCDCEFFRPGENHT